MLSYLLYKLGEKNYIFYQFFYEICTNFFHFFFQVTDNTRKNENLVQQPQIKNLPTQQVTDDLKMGSITEVWKNSSEWKKFTNFLDTSEPEGYDSSGVPMKLSRYAIFLQIYVNLYYKEKELLGKY